MLLFFNFFSTSWIALATPTFSGPFRNWQAASPVFILLSIKAQFRRQTLFNRQVCNTVPVRLEHCYCNCHFSTIMSSRSLQKFDSLIITIILIVISHSILHLHLTRQEDGRQAALREESSVESLEDQVASQAAIIRQMTIKVCVLLSLSQRLLCYLCTADPSH